MRDTTARRAAAVLTAGLTLAMPATALAARSLSISLPHHTRVHKHFRLTVHGSGGAQDTLNVYLDHRRCAKHGFDEDSRAGTKEIILDAGFKGRFTRGITVDPLSTRRVYVCAYLTYPVGHEIARQASYKPARR